MHSPLSPGENVNQAFECDIQGNCLAECYSVLLSPTAKTAFIKPSCTIQYEVLDMELWRCLPRHWIDHKSNCTAASLSVHTLVSECRHWHKPYFFCLFFFFFVFLFLSSWVQEKLSSQQERQKDQQVHVRVQEEWNVWYGWRADVWGGHIVPKAEWSQTQTGGHRRWVADGNPYREMPLLSTSDVIAYLRLHIWILSGALFLLNLAI